MTAQAYGELKPGSSHVHACIRNVGSKDITLPAKTTIGEITAAKVIPANLALKVKGITIQQELAVYDSKELDQSILGKLDLLVLVICNNDDKKSAKAQLHEYSSIFAKDDMDLGKTSVVKHSIKLSDLVPFKERYRQIPPGLYHEVRDHIKDIDHVNVLGLALLC